MSRYYDTVTHRFVNSDGYFTTGLNPLDANMNIYCRNNPVNCFDPTGEVTSMYIRMDMLFNPNSTYILEDAVRAAKFEQNNNIALNYGERSSSKSSNWAPFRTYETNGTYFFHGNTSSNASQYSYFLDQDNYLVSEVSVTTFNIGDFSYNAHLDSDGNLIAYYSVNNNGTTNSLTLGFSRNTLSVGWDTDNAASNNYHTFSSSGFEADYWGIKAAFALAGVLVAVPELIPVVATGGSVAFG